MLATRVRVSDRVVVPTNVKTPDTLRTQDRVVLPAKDRDPLNVRAMDRITVPVKDMDPETPLDTPRVQVPVKDIELLVNVRVMDRVVVPINVRDPVSVRTMDRVVLPADVTDPIKGRCVCLVIAPTVDTEPAKDSWYPETGLVCRIVGWLGEERPILDKTDSYSFLQPNVTEDADADSGRRCALESYSARCRISADGGKPLAAERILDVEGTAKGLDIPRLD